MLNLNFFVGNGVKVKCIKIVVLSKIWLNYYSFLIGLYFESYGIVSNNFWDLVY